ncbi:MAG: hypothetical protein A3H96_05460 [Acidobacteria bacterium RIFCSPLOWO2_02_FULL_67_36]|nr:MAG: hypothetical protein A3H96_05460 [Acidobacteria bacterium RIFCSPLOWO2_02_FULL_67_36]OFW21688.1 MAG: hypothetical protein A3G21_14945 [Acidobacteria bacterium RIFCSPLOWO2_12_FULL_66_21]
MSDNRTRIWFSLFVLAVFCVGLAGGTIIGRRLGPPPLRDGGFGMAMRGGGPGPGPGGPSPGMLIERLDRELQLTPEQRTKIEEIFKARRPRLEAVQDEMVKRAQQEQHDFQEEIRKILTPEQQQRFERWLQEAPRGRGRGRGFSPMGPR